MTRGATRETVSKKKSVDDALMEPPLCVQDTRALRDAAVAQERTAKATEDNTRALWAIVKQLQKLNERTEAIDKRLAKLESKLAEGVKVYQSSVGMRGSF